MNDGPRISKRLADHWGERVAARRKALKWTQTQLAEVSGVTQQTISNIEAGAGLPRDDIKLALSIALGLPPAELFEWPPTDTLAAAS